MKEHFQHKPKRCIQNNRFHTGNPDPILTLVAMALCRLGGRRGRVMWRWHTSLLLLLGLGPASLFPPFSLHPAAAGSSLHLPARSSSQAAASAASLGRSPGGATFFFQGTQPCSPADRSSRPLAACPCIGKAFIFLLLGFEQAPSPLPLLVAFQLSCVLLYSLQKRTSLQYF